MTPPKRPPTHVGDRGESRTRTPGRGVPVETLPPPRNDFDFEGSTPPAMDPHTYRALKKIREDMLTADSKHAQRLDQVELGQANLATAATGLAVRLNGVEISHARMEGAFSVMTGAILEERDEKKKIAEHKRRVGLRWLQIIGGATSSGGIIVVIILALLGKC